MTRDEVPTQLLMQLDDLARQIQQRILSAIAGWDVSAVNSCQPTRKGQPVQLLDYEPIVIHELVVILAVADVALV